jgi:membrane protein DedA with SNARE-associated domain
VLADIAQIGYPVVLMLVMAESSGIPVPGETALITASIGASQGKLELPLVIALAASGAIIGDNLGYWFGRRGGRWLLERPGRFARQRRAVLEYGEPFFERHGPKAVFYGRWILGLRVWASWLAGATRMPWRTFLGWNAAGGIAWATTVGVLAYLAGSAAESVFKAFGLIALGAIAVAGLTLLAMRRRRAAAGRRR